MRRRGHALLLVMTLLTAVAAGGLAFAARHAVEVEGHRGATLRLQGLWLARSALTSGKKGTFEQTTPLGVARIEVRRSPGAASAEVLLAGARVLVRSGGASGWEESYDAPREP